MTLQEYVRVNYDGSPYWFEDEVQQTWHTNRIRNILDIKEYLSGKHRILNRPNETWNGVPYETRKIILQLPKTLCNFETSFLLRNPATLTCEDKDTLEAFKTVYSKGRYNGIDFKLLDKMVKYGEVYEYPYINDKGNIVSRIIPPEDSYPVYDERGKMIAFIEYYIIDGISYYTVYTDDEVATYNDEGQYIKQTGIYENVSGLPIQYKTINEMDSESGTSSIEDYITIVDTLEDLISKYTDGLHKYIAGIPVLTGEKLKIGKKGEGQIDPNAVGYVMQLEMGSEFDIVQNKMDSQSFKALYDVLVNNLLVAAQTPSIALNQQELSNISETSIKMTYSLATIKGRMNANSMVDGFIERWDKFKELLTLQGVEVDGDIDCEFDYDIPESSKDIINDITTLKENNLISTETALSRSPYTYDIQTEMKRLKDDEVRGNNKDKDDKKDINDKDK